MLKFHMLKMFSYFPKLTDKTKAKNSQNLQDLVSHIPVMDHGGTAVTASWFSQEH